MGLNGVSLKGKTALVTGSTSGIGFGIAYALASEGASIVLNGFGDHTICQREIASLGVDVGYHPADLTRPDEIAQMMDHVERVHGGADILVNNAGIQYVARIVDFPPEKWDAIIATNLSASFHTIRRALPLMLERRWGRIINTASTLGLVGTPNKVAYVAAKHGLVGLTKVVALETAQSPVTCNAICPGWTLTPLTEPQIRTRAEKEQTSFDEASAATLSKQQPSGAFVTPEQLAALVLFLCSEAASQVRGATFVMDGGWTAQ